MKSQQIKQMDQIEHVLKKPSMYVGSIAHEEQEEFMLNENHTEFEMNKRSYIPALVKIFNEIIDNSIDEYVRTNGKHSNKISVNMTDKTFECKDNGRGIPNTKMTTLKGESKYQAEVAFTEMLSGANYENDDEATIGTNGLGSKAASIFSKKSIIKNDDGKECITITTKDNLNYVDVKTEQSKTPGVHTKIYPDLEYFGIDTIDEMTHNVIKERLLHLSISYPEITFKFNNRVLRLNTKKYFEMFNAKEFIDINENVSLALTHSPSDQFEHFSLVNGLVTKSGGSHINLLSSEIITPIREKLVKKFKTIKPGDIKQKLRVILIFREFKNTRYTSQTKEQVTNSISEIKKYLGDYNLDSFVTRVLKNKDIMLPITELFLLKEQAKRNAELKSLKTSKKIKSDKYLPATENKKYLMIVEGECLEENTKIMMSDYSTKKIKDIEIGEKIISGDLSVQTVQSKSKLLKETITFNTPSGQITSGKNHRFKVYDMDAKEFIFLEAELIAKNYKRYKFLKSKINSETHALKILKNNTVDKIIELEEGYISYTDDDFFTIIRNNMVMRVHSSEMLVYDLILMS